MKYYHYTNKIIYDIILEVGYLPPYYFNTGGDIQKENLVRMIKRFRKKGKGIYLWTEINESLCRDFYFYQRLFNNVKHGIVLEVQVPKKYNLLSKRMKYDYDENINLSHDFEAGIIKHRNVKFDIYLSRIPIDYINKIMEAKLVITKS